MNERNSNRRKAEELFEQVVSLPAEAQRSFLEEHCHDTALRAEVEKLLDFDRVYPGSRTVDVVPPTPGARVHESAPGRGDLPIPSPPRPTSSSAGFGHGRFLPGIVIGERYRIVGLLGTGGMGEVYRADDLELGQSVALKFLPERPAGDDAALERFRGEVRLARQVSHPNVCRVYDIGQVDGHYFLSMEYVDGEDLGLLLKRIGRFPGDRATKLARQLCLGLAAAHEKGVLHRDLKPANVMVDGRGKLLITDFGLAELAGGVSSEDVRSGTPAYMAPEQLAGREVTERSDIYSLGLVLHEVFTGKPVWEAGTLAELFEKREHTQTPTPSSHVDDLDPAVERVIQRCLEADPEKRPSSAVSVVAALPGGDPLQAALAAGETPSPELVAAQGSGNAMRPMVAVSLAIVGLALFMGATRWAGTMSDLHYLPLEKPPEVMIDRAQGILDELGYREPAYSDPVDQAWGLIRRQAFFELARGVDDSDERWEKLRERPDVVVFWYRQAPRLLVPYARVKSGEIIPTRGFVRYWNPPSTLAGSVFMGLDLDGNLARLEVAPKRLSTVEADETDWGPLFALAGLDPTRFEPDRPRYQRLYAPDYRSAWIGTRPERPDVELRVEAGSYEGRPIWFDVSPAASLEDQARDPEPFRRGMAEIVWYSLPGLLILIVLLFSVRLVVHNLKQGRADRRGALRLAVFLGSLHFAVVGLRSHTLFSPLWITDIFTSLAVGVFGGLAFWTVYIAAEPMGRRVWPRMFVSSSRLLSRPHIEWKDPLIGRSVLIGLILGVFCYLMRTPLRLTIDLWWNGNSLPLPYQHDLLLGQREASSVLLKEIGTRTAFLFVFVVALVVLRLLVKRTWVAVGLAVLLWSLIDNETDITSLESTSYALVANTVLMVVLLRWGFVAMLVAGLTLPMARIACSTDLSAWHARPAVLALVLVVVLTIYGLWAAMGSRHESICGSNDRWFADQKNSTAVFHGYDL